MQKIKLTKEQKVSVQVSMQDLCRLILVNTFCTCIKCLPNSNILDQPKSKAFADAKTNWLKNSNLFWERKHCGKKRKCWLPAFFPFPTMFSKGFLPWVVKSRDFEVKS